ncbi:agamous-like MADS-box protein AGL61 [Zingiber officinale]|uniref:agamous-like MADS-box protein AGL61 n=1 Tax=Zingiber officinale TaxID=94328 RepID=UPI001C4A7683|nr:agamous-like MADS-box protein AGL61 [Zingiber officinale]
MSLEGDNVEGGGHKMPLEATGGRQQEGRGMRRWRSRERLGLFRVGVCTCKTREGDFIPVVWPRGGLGKRGPEDLKASELSILCGAEIARLAFSPNGKPFSYGHPSVKSILERFFGDSADAAPATPPRHLLSAVLVQALAHQEKELQERLEAGWRRKATLEEALRGRSGVL